MDVYEPNAILLYSIPLQICAFPGGGWSYLLVIISLRFKKNLSLAYPVQNLLEKSNIGK